MTLKPGGVMEWHSTGAREELLIALVGLLRVECAAGRGRTRRTALRAGQCAFIPSATRHRVVNASHRPSRYVYITG